MFAQNRFSNGFGNGTFMSDHAPVASSRSISHGYVQPSFNNSYNGYAQDRSQRGFTEDRNRFTDERDTNRSFAPVQNRNNRENLRGFGDGFSGDRDQDGFRGR